MNWLRKFMAGRYGADPLSMGLLIFSMLLTFSADVAGLGLLSYLGLLPAAYCLFRMLSRNIERRRRENAEFMKLVNAVRSFFKRLAFRIKDSKTNRIFHCPKCRQRLRVPRGKGRITVRCPKCDTRFDGKT